jgi:putative PEP-CTERM system histidine kinase
MTTVTAISLVSALVAYTFLSLLLAIHARSKPALRWLLGASVATLLWACVLLGLAYLQPALLADWIWVIDGARNAAWLIFVAGLLPRGSLMAIRTGLFGTAVAAVVILAIEPVTGLAMPPFSGRESMLMLALSLLGLVGIEQLFRNADAEEKRALGLLALALGVLFVFDLFVYSQGLLLVSLDQGLWSARGFVVVLIVPLFVVTAQHFPGWRSQLYVSRPMVFYAATLFGAGLYLMAMSMVGYWLLARGGEWGATVQAVFLVAAGLLLAVVLFSSRFRARIRVFVSKHFFRGRYDYRREWLRLIGTLADQHGGSAAQRALKALCDIVQAPSGQLWLLKEDAADYCVAALLGESAEHSYGADDPVMQFLAASNWIVDTDEYRQDPEKYGHVFRTVPDRSLPPGSVLVPLRHEDQLLGVARLEKPAGQRPLNFEDHDLLKTVGQQMAVYIAQEMAREQLYQTRQFEAFHRTTAFLMHDLKNLTAQQALLVQNAPRLKHKPGFVDDAFRTIEHCVERMRRLLDQLQHGVSAPVVTRINLTPILEEAVAEASARRPVPQLQVEAYCSVRGDRDKLAMIFAHAIKNAQDATPADGQVSVRLWRHEDAEVSVEIKDTGCGMDEAFIREDLFRPFVTTKGASGMGIGAYQIREYLRVLGGRLVVESLPGKGTRLQMIMPAEEPP